MIDAAAWGIYSPHGDATYSTAATPGIEGRTVQVLTVTVAQPSSPVYATGLGQTLAAGVAPGHVIRLDFWAKSAQPDAVRVVVEQAGPPYSGYLALPIAIPARWTHFSAQTSIVGFSPGTAAIRFQVGTQSDMLELAHITLQDTGPDPAYAQADAALQPGAIQARIEKYRMADLKIVVRDSRGHPVPGAQVTLTQTRHAFLFGCNIFLLRQDDPDAAARSAYRNEFAALFNYATLPFYWGEFEWTQGKPDFDKLIWMAQWCHDHGIVCKAHPLVWHQVYPQWAPGDPAEAIPLLHRRVADIITRMGDLAPYEDIVNEASTGAQVQSPPNGVSRWIVQDGAPKVIETVLGWARAADPGHRHTFIYNDYETGPANIAVWTQMKADGDLPDAVGIQSHMHAGVWPIEKVWNVAQTFGQFGVPVHFTETTVLSTDRPHTVDPNAPAATDWLTDPAGEASQAAYVVKFYTALFSNPHVRAITWWDFSDRGSWMGAPSGLVRSDMSPKPAYAALLELIKHRWWTTGSGTTGSAGSWTKHAFYGDYTVTATLPSGKTVTQSITMPEASGPHVFTIEAR